MRRTGLVVCAVIVVAIAYGGYLLYEDSARDKAFNAVSAGMTESAVEAALGPPHERRRGCRDTPSWMGAPVAPTECAVEFVYYAHFGPIFWTVGFDRNGQAISKAAYVSP